MVTSQVVSKTFRRDRCEDGLFQQRLVLGSWIVVEFCEALEVVYVVHRKTKVPSMSLSMLNERFNVYSTYVMYPCN